jgi:glucose dehydrogenase
LRERPADFFQFHVPTGWLRLHGAEHQIFSFGFGCQRAWSTASLLAFRPKAGEIVWYYQFTPNETYDFDATWEPILADIRVNGEERNVVMQLNRNGFLYVLDRTNVEAALGQAV